eukprot:CAMPEP_0170530182 /NCGR_PEP_ID=MMETSP0209-20121228/42549_1 /TAXON_ID=665100 ORGANISM="Litonotus pictus, Strain P1" /NCGR_SAMPLE_ID=MMETSP0209 /ASSEMBLY_ACC=CAM_ASM_000301 /LENGTH=182 /DNA_ID=CAMNT_0010823005 /DNA_START=268 /DNA_END=812 /DNA_ORIENTATION=-
MVKAAKARNPLNKENIEIMNNEDLSLFKDGSLRTVISGFSLHLVSNPLQMLKETRRVLDKNNKEASAVFSIWGRPENNFPFTIIPSILKEMGIKLPNERSNFHLSTKDVCLSLCKEAGFENIFLEYQSYILNYESVKEMDFIFQEPDFVVFLESLGVEKAEALKSKVLEAYDKEFKEKKRIT